MERVRARMEQEGGRWSMVEAGTVARLGANMGDLEGLRRRPDSG